MMRHLFISLVCLLALGLCAGCQSPRHDPSTDVLPTVRPDATPTPEPKDSRILPTD